MSFLNRQKKLLQLIETKRTEMVEVAAAEGFSSGETLRKSIELDSLLNLYQQNFSKVSNEKSIEFL
jgi:transcriptional regulator GlxA family with amidase domain